MAAPTSLSPNFCELRLSCPGALCQDYRKSMEDNQVSVQRPTALTLFLNKRPWIIVPQLASRDNNLLVIVAKS